MGKAWNSTLSAGKGFKSRTSSLKRSQKPVGAPRRRGLAKVRKDTVGKLKIKLWAITRLIIIKQHGDTCYTCGANDLRGSNRHVGHFISSSVCSAELRYSLDNLRIQCYRCNIHLSGNWLAYERHLIADSVDVDELKRRNESTKGMKADSLFYEAKIAEYQTLLTQLESGTLP